MQSTASKSTVLVLAVLAVGSDTAILSANDGGDLVASLGEYNTLRDGSPIDLVEQLMQVQQGAAANVDALTEANCTPTGLPVTKWLRMRLVMGNWLVWWRK
jgi:hypothetical protein